MAKNTFDSLKALTTRPFMGYAVDPSQREFFDNKCARGSHRDGWFLFVGFEQRGYPVFLQRANDERTIHVSAGCRYFTLRQAMAHWGRRSKGQQGKQILQLIAIGLRRAVNRGFIKRRFFPHYFDDKLRR
jgi:hypothetical protein